MHWLPNLFRYIPHVGAERKQYNRESLFVGEYSLSQTSLEQVFNGFAAQQEEELGRAAGMA